MVLFLDEHPNQPNPVASPTQPANPPSQQTGSNIVPSTDPFPPQGANQSQQQSASPPSPTSSAPSKTPVVSSGPNSSVANSPTAGSSSASPSSVSSLVASPTQSSPTVVAAPVHTVGTYFPNSTFTCASVFCLICASGPP